MHLKIKRFFCDICPIGFYVENDLKRHKVSHEHPTIPCTHEGCDKMFSSEYRLRAHFRGCHIEKEATIPCTYPNCVKLFAVKSLLTFHIKYTHLKERSHICPICKKGK